MALFLHPFVQRHQVQRPHQWRQREASDSSILSTRRTAVPVQQFVMLSVCLATGVMAG